MNFNVGVMKEAMVSSVDLPINVGIHDGHHCVRRAVPQVVVHGEEDKSGGETPEPNHVVLSSFQVRLQKERVTDEK